MKVAIVEDETFFQNSLVKALHAWNTEHISLDIDIFSSGETIIKKFQKDRICFDLIFIDIMLDGIDGLETARRLRSMGCDDAIVFTTGHTDFNFMQQGYSVRASNYFKKPITVENIASCINQLDQNRAYVFCYNGQKTSVLYKEIVCFESYKNYILINVADANVKVPKHKSTMEAVLQQVPDSFVQCHRSYVVNMAYAIMVKGKNLIVRGLEHPLPISDNFLESVLGAFRKFL